MATWRLWLLGDSPTPPEHLRRWRAGEAAWNMALDESVLDAVSRDMSPPTLRLYQWARPAVTVGRFQNVERTIDSAACEQANVPVVRRITGGRGILHGHDLTLGLIVPFGEIGLPTSHQSGIAEIYRRLGAGIVAALSEIGVSCRMGARGAKASTHDAEGDCMRIAGQADIVHRDGAGKLVGSALLRRGAVVLQQSSIPLSESRPSDGLRLFRGASRSAASGDAPPIAAEDLAARIAAATAAELGCIWERNLISEHELRRAAEIAEERYGPALSPERREDQ